MSVTRIAFDLHVDWDGDGDFSDTGEDVTPRTLLNPNVGFERGSDQNRVLAPPAPGRIFFVLDNRTQDYSAEYGPSPLAGLLEIGKTIRLTATSGASGLLTDNSGNVFTDNDGNSFTIGEGAPVAFHTGRIKSFEQLPAFGDRRVAITGLGNFSSLIGQKVSTGVYQNILVSDAIDILLDAAGWPALDRDIEESLTTLDWWWVGDQDAFEALSELGYSEGPGAKWYEDAEGKAVFRNRHHRLTRTRSTTSQFTFTSFDYLTRGTKYDPHRDDVINLVSFPVVERVVGVETVIWEFNEEFSLGPNESRVFVVSGSDIFIEAQVPVTTNGTSAVQQLTVDGASGGNIAVSFNNPTGSTESVGITYNETTANVQSAIESLSTVGEGNIVATGGNLNAVPILITFQNDLANQPLPLLAIENHLVLGSKNPIVAVETVTEGINADIIITDGSLASATLSRTSGASVDLTIVAGAGGLTATRVAVRAKPVQVTKESTVTHSLDTSVSQAKYGPRSYPYSIRAEIDRETAQDLADFIVYLYQSPRPTMTIPGVMESDETIQAYQLAAEISDRVTIVEPQTGINGDFFLEHRRDQITEFGLMTDFGTEKAWDDAFVSGLALLGAWEIGTGMIAF